MIFESMSMMTADPSERLATHWNGALGLMLSVATAEGNSTRDSYRDGKRFVILTAAWPYTNRCRS